MQGVKAPIDREQVLILASKFWKPKQIAAFFKVSERTIYNIVNAEELAQAREEGCGNLIDLAWERAKFDKSPAVLIHLLQVYRDEVPQPRRALEDISNDELALEVSRRVSAAKMIKSGEFRKLLAAETKLPSAAEAAEAPGGKPPDDSSSGQ